MTDTTTDEGTGDELDPDEQAGVDLENEDGEGEGDKPTYEELQAERDELQRRLNRQRTAKAREARHAKDKPVKNDAAAEAAAAALAEKDARIAELETKHNQAQALAVAAELGFKKPSMAVRLVDFGDLDDPGDPDEVRAALRQVLKENPELKRSPARADGGQGAGQEAGARTSFNDVIRRAAGRA
jgi:hypothetical protein